MQLYVVNDKNWSQKSANKILSRATPSAVNLREMADDTSPIKPDNKTVHSAAFQVWQPFNLSSPNIPRSRAFCAVTYCGRRSDRHKHSNAGRHNSSGTIIKRAHPDWQLHATDRRCAIAV